MKMLDAAAINYAKSQKLNGSNAAIERALADAFKAGYEYRKRLSFAEAYTHPMCYLRQSIHCGLP